MFDQSVGVLLVVTPDQNGIKEALRVKIGMKQIGMQVMGVVINENSEQTVPHHVIEDMLRLQVFNPPQKAN